MMATVPHVTSGLGLRKFQADGFLLTRVNTVIRKLRWRLPRNFKYQCTLSIIIYVCRGLSIGTRIFSTSDFPFNCVHTRLFLVKLMMVSVRNMLFN